MILSYSKGIEPQTQVYLLFESNIPSNMIERSRIIGSSFAF